MLGQYLKYLPNINPTLAPLFSMDSRDLWRVGLYILADCDWGGDVMAMCHDADSPDDTAVLGQLILSLL